MKIQELKKIILTQREEIEEKIKNERIILRDIDFSRLKNYLSHPNILTILGVRRCGKSVLSLQILRENKNFLYINFDDERLIDFSVRDFDNLLEAYYELYGESDYFILDEPHNISGWELFVNRLRRTKKIIITGSNSKLLSGELATHLTGRYIDFVLFPFSLKEFLKLKDFSFIENDFYSPKKRAMIKRLVEEYIESGGFPERYHFGREILVRIYSDIIEKDILKRYKIKNKRTFKEMVRYMISNYGCEISFNKLKNVFGIKDIHTIKNWFSFLESAYLIFILERFSFKLKNQMIAPKKVYCIDMGLANTVSFKTQENRGKVIENLVAIELFRRKSYINKDLEIYYWKDYMQNEIDFIIKEKENVMQLIQVCYDVSDYRTKEREVKGLLKGSRELRCDDLLVITWDYDGEEIFDFDNLKRKIKFVSLWRWLLIRGTY
jgi:predicted AAA+ superfamily ATPase